MLWGIASELNRKKEHNNEGYGGTVNYFCDSSVNGRLCQ